MDTMWIILLILLVVVALLAYTGYLGDLIKKLSNPAVKKDSSEMLDHDETVVVGPAPPALVADSDVKLGSPVEFLGRSGTVVADTVVGVQVNWADGNDEPKYVNKSELKFGKLKMD